MAEYNYGNDDIMVGVGGAAPLPNGQQPPVIGGAARVVAGAPQVQIVYDTAAIDGLKAEVARLKAQNDVVKQLAREAEKKGEIAKHKSPEVKRSLSYLLDSKFDLQDMHEIMQVAASANDFNSICSAFNQVVERVAGMQTKVEAEVLANQIARTSEHGWRTVKHFETNSLFTGEDAEAMTKRLKKANLAAAKDLQQKSR